MTNIFIIMPSSGAPRTCAHDLSILPLDSIPTPHRNFKLKISFQGIYSKIKLCIYECFNMMEVFNDYKYLLSRSSKHIRIK